MVGSCLLITLIKCLKGHKSLGSLYSVVKTLIVCGNRQSKGRTRSPIELFWTAKHPCEHFVVKFLHHSLCNLTTRSPRPYGDHTDVGFLWLDYKDAFRLKACVYMYLGGIIFIETRHGFSQFSSACLVTHLSRPETSCARTPRPTDCDRRGHWSWKIFAGQCLPRM